MNPNQLKQLEKLAKVFNTEAVITQDEVVELLEGIAKILNNYKQSTEEINKETKDLINRAISQISDEHDSILTSVEKTSQNAKYEVTEAIQKALKEVKDIAKEVLEMKPRDGVDADEEYIIERVLSEIKLPEYKETVLDTPEELRDKLSSLKGEDRLSVEAIKGIEQYTTEKNLNRAIEILDQRTQYLINKRTSSTAGASSFLDLTDTPSSYAGEGGKAVRVNAGETGLEFFAATGSGTVTSVSATVPAGLTISGSPITTSGTLAIGLDTGRVIPLQSTIDGKLNTTLTSANIFVGNGSNIATGVAMSGDATIANTGALTIANNAVTFVKMQNVSSTILLGRHAAGSGTVQEVSVSGGVEFSGSGIRRSALTGDVTASAGSNTTTIANLAVTNAKINDVAWSKVTGTPTTLAGYGITNGALNGAVTGSGITMSTARILGRTTASTGAIEEISIGSGLSLSGGTLSATGGISDGDKGDITVSSSGTVWTIDNTAVTYAKIQNVAANTFLANATGSSATVQEISTARIPLFASAITGTPSGTTFLRGDGTWATPSGGGSPGGSSGNVQFNNAGAFGGMSGTTWDDTNRTLGITGATLTASNPILNLSQTWNNAAVDFVGATINITNTASAARSVIFRTSVGGTSVFDVRTDNTIILGDSFSGTRFGIQAANGIRAMQSASGSLSPSGFYGGDIRAGGNATSSQFNNYLGGTIGLIVLSSGSIGFSNTSNTDLRGTQDTVFFRDGAGQMAQRNGTNSQSFRVYKTFTDASNFERLEINGTSTSGWLQIIANSAGTGSANLGVAITPRGNGAISANVADSTAAGGNARGTNAVDWQMSRASASQVASGDFAVIAGGQSNTASGTRATVSGGLTNTASGSNSWVPGGTQATTRSLGGAYAYSSGQRAAQGDAQVIGQPVRRTTTDATPVSLATNGTPAVSTVMVLPANSTLLATAIVTCRDASGNSAAFKAEALFKRDGANNTTRLGFATVTQIGTPDAAVSTANIDLVANDTLEAAEIQVTGVAATTIHWVGELKCVQVL